MEEFRKNILDKATEYLGYAPSNLSVDLAIEQYKDCRSFPDNYTDDRILEDMKKSFNKIAMAVVEIDAREGIEGQTAHSESGVNRTYGDNPIPKAYSGVIQLVHVC